MPNNVKNVLLTIAFEKDKVRPSTHHALEQAIQVAERNGSRLILAHVLEVSERARKKLLEDTESAGHQHYQKVQAALAELARSAQERGVQVECEVLFGKSWTTLIQLVQRRNIDLLMAGPASRGPVLESLFGSTTLKLVKKCPCPVWVTKPREGATLKNVLVAHDLTPVGASALRWGVAAAERNQAELYVLHALEPDQHFGFLESVPSGVIKGERDKAEERIRDELKQLDYAGPAEVSVTVGSPQVEIFNFLKENSIELLVMGTVARTGISGLVTGNTAETLLPWVECSLIALKPEGFVSPVEP